MSRFHVDGEQLAVLKSAIAQLRTYIRAVKQLESDGEGRLWISVGGDKTPEQLADDAEEVLRELELPPKL